jgi:hypothetical protein
VTSLPAESASFASGSEHAVARTLVRALLLLALSAWLGGLLFFGAVVAPVAFGTVMPMLPDPALGVHVAGTMVRGSLLALHWIGLVAGALMIFLLAVEAALQWRRRSITPPVAVLVAMLALTACLQFSVLPRMEVLRQQNSAAIDALPGTLTPQAAEEPARVEFNRLHQCSTQLEGAVLLGGLALLVLLARPEPTA